MSLNKRLDAFVTLGTFLSQFTTQGVQQKENIPFNDLFFDVFKTQINRAQETNSWFTKENVLFSLENWSKAFTQENLTQWLSSYELPANTTSKNIAIIMAGNIPLVGFHDFICVAILGNHVTAKLSSNDKYFIPLIAKYLEHVNPDFKGSFTFTENKLEGFDAVIATGSDNTARYFEYYFGKYPHIIRKNRNSVAILTGNESPETLNKLGEDIFRYFGLGCRNVSKIFIPRNYNLDLLFKALYPYHNIINYKKYENNYDYNKAVYLMSLFHILENSFLMLKEDKSYSSPIATLFYEYYDDLEVLSQKLRDEQDKIQCVVSDLDHPSHIKMGYSQKPMLQEYADNVDTINFILNL